MYIENKQLSPEWIAQKVSNWHDRDFILKAFDKGVDSEIIRDYFNSQLIYIMTEWGTKHPLNFQPTYEFNLAQENGKFKVTDLGREALGEKSERYLEYSDLGDAPNYGLYRAYQMLLAGEESVLIYSPAEIYKNFGSRNDVLLFMGKDPRGAFWGKYIFIDQLNTAQRQNLLSQFSSFSPRFSNPTTIVSSPIVISIDAMTQEQNFLSNPTNQNQIEVIMQDIARRFKIKFGKDIFENTVSAELLKMIVQTLSPSINNLWQLMLRGDVDSYNDKLLNIINITQKKYAKYIGLDPEKYLEDIVRGIYILGIDEGGAGASQIFNNTPFAPWAVWQRKEAFRQCLKCHQVFFGDKDLCSACR